MVAGYGNVSHKLFCDPSGTVSSTISRGFVMVNVVMIYSCWLVVTVHGRGVCVAVGVGGGLGREPLLIPTHTKMYYFRLEHPIVYFQEIGSISSLYRGV